VKKNHSSLPSPQELLDYIQQHKGEVNRRDIAKAFGIKGQDRVALKTALRELAQNPAIQKRGKRYTSLESTSSLITARIVKITEDDELIGVPEEGEVRQEIIIRSRHPGTSLSLINLGDDVLIKIDEQGAYLVRKLKQKEEHILGIFHTTPEGNLVIPASRKIRDQYMISEPHRLGAQEGDLVEVKPLSSSARGKIPGKITRILGSILEPKSMSLIAIHTYELPLEFSKFAIDLANRATVPSLEEREDLRDIPLVTIDDEDARDFDDAVWATPDTDPDNSGGWHLVVAIADVSYYVHPGDTLDQEAFIRGNSIYFPDRVIPMLPESLSNGLCSLKPHEDRACLAVHLWINKTGKLLKHRFVRGLMRSAQRLTYRETQDAVDGKETRLSQTFVKDIIQPLYSAYDALNKGRIKRDPLNLDLPEERIYLNEQGKIEKISPRPRFDSHRLIEEFMITANVAAAISLDENRTFCMYRIHDKPSPEKLEALRDFLQGVHLGFPKGQAPKPTLFNQILVQAAGTPYEHAVNELILRTQSQAIYSPDNIGHFGLYLPRYAHFTSPIRRYADLLVHRGLVSALKLPGIPEFPYSHEQFKDMGAHISMTERRASTAERETTDRYVSAYLAQNKGQTFEGRISGVTDFALFLHLDENGADGMIPFRLLGSDYFIHDPVHHRLIGRRTKKVYGLGDKIKAVLMDADPVKGSIIFAPSVSKDDLSRAKKFKKRRHLSPKTTS
jgi:ribonuclease R